MSKKSVKEIKNKKDGKKETKENSTLKSHITEKATFLNEKGAYVFKIKPGFNKIMIKEAIKKTYNVSPIKVSVINIPSKTAFVRTRRVEKPGYRKAVVYLKKGEKINIA